jgi:hypothetical protein
MYILQKHLPSGSYDALSKEGSAQYRSYQYVMNQDPYVYDWEGIQSEDATAVRNFLQRYVLNTIYYSLNGKDWDENANWNSQMDVCTWYGVGCDGIPYEEGTYDASTEGIVTSLSLSDNNLVGKLAGDVSALSELNALEFHSNYIEGTIPPSFYTMTSLSVLFLDDNYISGSISNSIGKMNLERLTLSDNDMVGSIPAEMGDMKDLVMVWLFNNEKMEGGIPESLGGLEKLGEWMLFGCCGCLGFYCLLTNRHCSFTTNTFVQKQRP